MIKLRIVCFYLDSIKTKIVQSIAESKGILKKYYLNSEVDTYFYIPTKYRVAIPYYLEFIAYQ